MWGLGWPTRAVQKSADHTMGYVDRRRCTISNCRKCRVKHDQYHVVREQRNRNASLAPVCNLIVNTRSWTAITPPNSARGAADYHLSKGDPSMTFRIIAPSAAALLIALGASAQAAPTASSSVFATGGPVGGTGPDSVTTGDGSVWIEYGNGADSTGASGSSTIVQYSPGGAVQHTYSIPGLVDGLKLNPTHRQQCGRCRTTTAMPTLSLINPTTTRFPGRCPMRRRPTPTARTAATARL